MRAARALPAVVLAAALLAGCSPMEEKAVSVPNSSDSATSAAAATNVLGFGSSYAYADGLILTASKPTTFTASDTAMGNETGNTAVKVTLVIENKTQQPFNPILAGMTLTYGDDGATAEIVADSVNKVGGTFSQVILPGKKATIVSGFSVPAGTKQVQGQFSVGDVIHEPIVFTGSL